jgi:D-sedoheptulose 7-phosphate isomerase
VLLAHCHNKGDDDDGTAVRAIVWWLAALRRAVQVSNRRKFRLRIEAESLASVQSWERMALRSGGNLAGVIVVGRRPQAASHGIAAWRFRRPRKEYTNMAEEPDDDALIAGFFGRSLVTLEGAAQDRELLRLISAIAQAIEGSLRAGGKLLIAGNGGSAADAQHLAAEFLSRYLVDRRPLPAVALTTDTSVLTAVGNDFGFEHVFERQVRGLGRSGDVFLAISTSGRSPNVLRALAAARDMGLVTIGFSGAAETDMRGLCQHFLRVASPETAIVQQIHMVAGHAICALVERAILQ